MLSPVKGIKTLRQLCKFMTGRTSPTPVASINKYLASNGVHDAYSVVLKEFRKKNTYSPLSVAQFEVRRVDGVPGNWTVKTPQIAIPTSPQEVVNTFVNLDASAEANYRLGYGRDARNRPRN